MGIYIKVYGSCISMVLMGTVQFSQACRRDCSKWFFKEMLIKSMFFYGIQVKDGGRRHYEDT